MRAGTNAGKDEGNDAERQPLLEDPRSGHDEPLIDAVDEDEPLKKKLPKKALDESMKFCEYWQSPAIPLLIYMNHSAKYILNLHNSQSSSHRCSSGHRARTHQTYPLAYL
jgi:hypothetical protein